MHNDRWPGPKKGTHSLAKARRQIEGDRRAAGLATNREWPGHAVTPLPPPPGGPMIPPDAWKSRAIDLPPRDPLAPPRLRHEDAVIGAALAIIEERMRTPQGGAFEQPQAVKDYLRLHLAGLDREVFGAMFLDVKQGLIAFEVLFEGTLSHTSVHPREVARRALQLNSAAVILAHNHPSGVAEPSRADQLLTIGLREALALLDVRVLDHVIVAGNTAMSFAERGRL